MKNNLNLFRLLLATAVLYMHSYTMIGQTSPNIWGHTFGGTAVQCFFIISGFLITQSFLRSPSVKVFAAKRILRLAPAGICALLLTRGLWLATGFEPLKVNGPLWTLPWESLCYVLCGMAGVYGLLRKQQAAALVAMAWLLYFLGVDGNSAFVLSAGPLLALFATGGFFALHWDNLKIGRYALFSAVMIVLINSPLYGPVLDSVGHVFGNAPQFNAIRLHFAIYYFVLTPLVLWIGLKTPLLPAPSADLSYGIYVYGWPMQTLLLYISGKMGWQWHSIAAYFPVALAMTVAVAAVSWYLVEKPAISMAHRKRRPVVTAHVARAETRQQSQCPN